MPLELSSWEWLALIAVAAAASRLLPRLKRVLCDPVVEVGPDDPEMLQALDAAQRTLGLFWQAVASPHPAIELFAIRVRCNTQEGVEHVWLRIAPGEADTHEGVLMNRPHRLRAAEGDVLPFTDEQIVDWMYMKAGHMVGGETLRVMIRKSPPKVARRMSEAYGLPYQPA
jgi:uncharacterized protein YegJ (DUF2314 family)